MAKVQPPTISEAESVILEVLWRRGTGCVEDIMSELPRDREWHESTVKTLLARLVKKGALRTVMEGRRFRYLPRIEREQWLSAETESLLDRLFGGRVAPLVAHFSKRQKLSARDIAELKKLIAELGDE
jgi:BlaI family transcriptional regulator, penicillinase repressor